MTQFEDPSPERGPGPSRQKGEKSVFHFMGGMPLCQPLPLCLPRRPGPARPLEKAEQLDQAAAEALFGGHRFHNAALLGIFIDGKAQLAPDTAPEVVLSLDIADFSSLVIGAVGLHKLIEYGLATISNKVYVSRLDQLFSGPKPVCLTQF